MGFLCFRWVGLLVAGHGLESECTQWLQRMGLVAQRHVDLSSPTRDQTHVPCIGRQILNCWTIREVPKLGSSDTEIVSDYPDGP